MTNSTNSGLRRWLCLLLAFVMLVSCTGLTAFADDGILLEEETESFMDDGILLEEEAESLIPPPVEIVLFEEDDGILSEEAGYAGEAFPTEGVSDAETFDAGAITSVDEDSEDSGNNAWAELQKAIDAAGDGDTVTLTQNVYAHGKDRRLVIYRNITLDLAGFSINRGLTDAEALTWDGDSVILVTSGASLTLINSNPGSTGVITGGNEPTRAGGGIYNMGTLTILGTEGGGISVVNNYAKLGGAIYNDTGAVLDMRGVTVSDNAAGTGGGIYNLGAATVTDSVIRNCPADYRGGGIYNDGTLDLVNTEIAFCEGTTEGGGALSNYIHGSMTVSGGYFHHNNALSGAGIYNRGVLTLSGDLRIEHNYAENNGAGINYYEGTLTITGGNPVIAKNTIYGKANNLFIHNGKLINVTGVIGPDAEICVTLQSGEGKVTSGLVASGNAIDNVRWNGFVGDNYRLRYVKSGWDSKDFDLVLLGEKSVGSVNKPFLNESDYVRPVTPDQVGDEDWMAAIPDTRYLYEINQVYSHDANTYEISHTRSIGPYYNVTKVYWPYAVCQEESLRDQMYDGVRLFDIRLSSVHCKKFDKNLGTWEYGGEGDGALYITHGKNDTGTFFCRYDDRDLTLDTILGWVKEFLTQHPSETIMLSFTGECIHLDRYHDRIFQYLRNHLEELANTINDSTGESFLYLEPGSNDFFAPYTKYPQLGDCRGKVFIMVDEERELDFVGGMIPEPSFAPVRQGQPGNNKIHADEKIKNVQTFLDEKINVPNAVMLPKGDEHLDVYYQISLNSHTEQFWDFYTAKNTPRDIYRDVNPAFFGPGKAFDQKGKYLGWVKMDGVTDTESRYVWRSNFPDDYKEIATITVQSGLDPARVRGAEIAYPDQSYTLWPGSEITFPENLYTVDDVGFRGWKVTDSEGSQVYQPGEKLTLEEDLTIEGTWEYQISNTVNIHIADSSYNKHVAVGSTVDLSDFEQPKKDGYTFVGWSTQNGTWDAGQTVTTGYFDTDTDGNLVRTEADNEGNTYNVITFEPIWEPIPVTVIYDTGDQSTAVIESTTIRMGETLTLPEAPYTEATKVFFDAWVLKKDTSKRFAAGENVVFDDWAFVTKGNENSQLLLEAAWTTQKRLLLRFDSMGGTLVDAIDTPAGSAIGEPDAPTRVGYTFAGWTDKDGSPVTWPHSIQADETLYATWTVKIHTISFSTPRGATQHEPITVAYGTPLTEFEDQLPDPTRPHYSFYNWLPQPPETMPDEDLELKAVWRQSEYTLEFDANGGKWVDDEGNETTSMDYTGNYNKSIGSVPAPSWEGHYFEGWTVEFTYVDGEEVPPEDPDALVYAPNRMPDVSTKYKAKWADHLWEVHYTWSKDYDSVRAMHVCVDDDTLTEIETVNTTAVVTKEPDCFNRGKTTYTAEFMNPAFKTQSLTVTNLDALGHDWGEWVVTRPATETEEGEETCTCSRDETHTMTRLIPAVWDASTADFVIPFPVIEEEAFAGIAATHIEVQPTVESIGPRAFADCPNLRKIHIPDSVAYVDETALDGCENVIVCGGSSAAFLAELNGFVFVAENVE